MFSIGVEWDSTTDPDDWWNSDIYEVLIYNKKLTEDEQVSINKYLSKKWNI